MIAGLSFGLALIYSLFVGFAVRTALRTDDPDRRDTAVEVLKILTGFKLPTPKAELLPESDKPRKRRRPK